MIALVLTLSGCSLLFPLDDFEFQATDGGIPAAVDADLGDAGDAGDAGEDLVDAGPREIAPRTVVARPYTDGVVCGELGALERGGELAGLGRTGSSTFDELDGQDVSACIEADFGPGLAVAAVVVARAAPEACGATCSLCGTGDELDVFADGRFVRTNALGPTLTELRLELGREVQSITVCRTGQGPARDQVAVDFLALER